MNKKQKCVLIIVGVVIFLMLIYPPFYHENRDWVLNMGYGFIDDPPKVGSTGYDAMVDEGTLVTQWLGVLIIGGIAWLLARDRK